jgi:hypothetical protein
MALTDSLVSYWKLDEASGTREDIHGPNDLTANGTGGVGSATGIINSGADLELGDSDFLSIADGSQTGLDVSGDLSVSFWTKYETLPTVGGADSNIITKTEGGTNRAYTIRFNNNISLGFECEASSDGTTANSGNGRTGVDALVVGDVGVWRHWVATYKLSTHTWKMYKDGSALSVTDNSAGTVSQVFNSTAVFRLGARGAAGVAAGFYDGVLDEVGIWSRELTSSEVTELYNAGAGLAYPFASTNTGAFFSFF